MNRKVKYNIITGVIISLLIIIITIISYSIHGYFNPTNVIDTEKLGHFGDFIGGFLGTVLTILATVLIYLTYNSQKKELSLNRKLLEQQQFENTFFNMLKVHQDLKSNIVFNTENCITRDQSSKISLNGYGTRPEEGFEIHGRVFLSRAANDLHRFFNHYPGSELQYFISKEINKKHIEQKFDFLEKISENSRSHKNHLRKILFKYRIFFDHYANYLGDYFRNLYHILKFISDKKSYELTNNQLDSKESIEKKYKNYADIVQSQMNFSELQLVYYNSFQFRKMRQLVREFDFIENLHSANLFDQYHINFKSLGNLKTN